MSEAIADQNPSLFDSPQHPWLEDYLPHPVNVIRKNKEELIAVAQREHDNLDQVEKSELEKYNWLLGLLTSTDKEFEEHAAEAMRFLGFEVKLIDETIAPGQRKKEDYHIKDLVTGYFSIGEAKATHRGANEGFLTDIQNHQARYSRDNKIPIPNGILIVNHSIDLEPSKRAGRFYTDPDLANRCYEQAITVIDSVALFSMCQSVLRGDIGSEEIRHFLESEFRIISTYSVPTTHSTA